ncbi:28S ribosomal protein S18c, mitochondrial isoform X2 [Hemicordylus capensis]|uniref:28S ribosomal protein S18c, mitochondrial isoform X2 n=1 Tax=Hemicordylus capensis TaxID=884348 RepID=UPI0023042D7F|nr:28S ribosomal protein S18c, mitochondrial isoform X2 [Hemicordylus capensis]
MLLRSRFPAAEARGNMAGMARLVAAPKGWGKLCYALAGTGKSGHASCAVISWRREYSLKQEQVSAKADMPVPMENPYKEPPRKCILCGMTVDYKNVQLLSQFVSPYTGHIFGRHITGFMAVTYKDPTFLSDPKICSIKYPE